MGFFLFFVINTCTKGERNLGFGFVTISGASFAVLFSTCCLSLPRSQLPLFSPIWKVKISRKGIFFVACLTWEMFKDTHPFMLYI